MNEQQLLDEHDPLPPPVKTSYWRLAAVMATLVGGGLCCLGRWAAVHDNGAVDSLYIILAIMLPPMVALLGFAGFWLVLGDGRWHHRVLQILGCVVVVAIAAMLSEKAMRPFTIMWGIPLTAAIAGMVLVVIPSYSARRTVGVVVVLAAITPWELVRMNGTDGSYFPDISFRWTPTSGELADAELSGRATSLPSANNSLKISHEVTSEDWPGFRGSERTGIVPAAALHGWNGSQPRKLWEHPVGKVGAAWSSFCIVGNALYTQEQRGSSESVVCYRADTGEEVWARGQESKHEDQPSGAGPRATPTFASGMIYAVSATGSVSCLNAATGEPVWFISLPEKFEAKRPVYGFSTSPLVVGNRVIINPSSDASPRLVALDANTGNTLWKTEALGTDGYSSPHPARIQDVDQVLIFDGTGLSGHEAATGRELWHYEWKVTKMQPVTVQPLVMEDGRIVIGGGNIGMGIRCVKVRKEGEGWRVEELWKSSKLTPKFNDVVRLGNTLYGLQSGHLVSISLKNGSYTWKDEASEKYYGQGQLMLAGDKLLVLSEDGKISCVAAKPDEYEELWEINGIKGKTWNHPAIAHGRLYVRNMGEMAAFDLGTADKK